MPAPTAVFRYLLFVLPAIFLFTSGARGPRRRCCSWASLPRGSGGAPGRARLRTGSDVLPGRRLSCGYAELRSSS
jgi:hypothetical protein